MTLEISYQRATAQQLAAYRNSEYPPVFRGDRPPAGPPQLAVTLPGKPAAFGTSCPLEFPVAVLFLGNFAGSFGSALTNPTSATSFKIKSNGFMVGTITVAPDGTVTFATPSGGAELTIHAGDCVTFESPAQDATLSDLSFTLVGKWLR